MNREGVSRTSPGLDPPPPTSHAQPFMAALAGAQDQDSWNLLEESMGLCFVPQILMGEPFPQATGGPASLLPVAAPRARLTVVWASPGLGPDLQKLRKTLLPPLLCPPGFLCLRSENVLVFVLGITILGVCHYTLTVKGSHLATHGALTESRRWSKIWAHFFVEVSLGVGEAAAGASVQACTAVCPRGQVAAAAGMWVQVCSLHYSVCLWCPGRWRYLWAENCMRGCTGIDGGGLGLGTPAPPGAPAQLSAALGQVVTGFLLPQTPVPGRS